MSLAGCPWVREGPRSVLRSCEQATPPEIPDLQRGGTSDAQHPVRQEVRVATRPASIRPQAGARALLEVVMIKGTCHCGAAGWTLEGDPGSITACNCTLCRRYGTLWAYDFENERIRLFGPTSVYMRAGKEAPTLEIRFCPTCACVIGWRGLHLTAEGRRRIAVNVRLAAPEDVAHLLIDPFDGLDSFEDQPRDGRCVRDLWS